MKFVEAFTLLLSAAVCGTASALGVVPSILPVHPSVPIVKPYPIGSIPLYHQPLVLPIPDDKLLFPSIPAHKTLLPPVLPTALGSLPLVHPFPDLAGILHSPLLDIFPLSAEAPSPSKAEAPTVSSEEFPFTAPSPAKSLAARKAGATHKRLQASASHRASVLQALGLPVTNPAPAPAPAYPYGQETAAEAPASSGSAAAAAAPALGPLPTPAFFTSVFTRFTSDVLAPTSAPEASATAPAASPGVDVLAPVYAPQAAVAGALPAGPVISGPIDRPLP